MSLQNTKLKFWAYFTLRHYTISQNDKYSVSSFVLYKMNEKTVMARFDHYRLRLVYVRAHYKYVMIIFIWFKQGVTDVYFYIWAIDQTKYSAILIIVAKPMSLPRTLPFLLNSVETDLDLFII